MVGWVKSNFILTEYLKIKGACFVSGGTETQAQVFGKQSNLM
jgi:hypothetical protein